VQVGNPGQANYAAAKGGVIALTKTVAKEFSSRAITCNAVAPGFIVSDMTDAIDDKYKEAALQFIPLGVFGIVVGQSKHQRCYRWGLASSRAELVSLHRHEIKLVFLL
jgi:NAD(P)-dependent dehydrogenase (short-subunit alcohol dehydrogenase family)